ncbi:hypothetical protein B0H16DRAFT_1391787, partial [Mycena metata]
MSPGLRVGGLCIDSVPGHLPDADKLKFLQWVHTGIPRVGSFLTHLRLILPTNFPLDVLADILSGLPSLTELKMRSNKRVFRYGIVPPLSGRTPQTDAFPPRLRALDISLLCGTSFFFQWLLSHADPPLLTSLSIAAYGPESDAHEDSTPLEAYLCRFGLQIRTLSLAYRLVQGVFDDWRLADTRAFHARIIPYAPRLVNQMLF